MSTPIVRGTLIIDASDLVENRFLDARELWYRCPHPIPHGVHVEINIGQAHHLLGDLHGAADALRNAGTLHVVGHHGSGVSAVYNALSVAYGYPLPEPEEDDL